MRETSRILPVLTEISKIWEKYPDLRLGQLLVNVYPSMKLYYIEDEDLVKGIKEFYDNE